jgi:hypothetical protein
VLASPSSASTLASSSGPTSSPALAVTAPSALALAPAPPSSSAPAAPPFHHDRFLPSASLGDAAAEAGAAALSPADAAAHTALARMFYSAGIVPMKDYRELAQKLIGEGIADERDLQITLGDDPGLLVSLRMKFAQQSCLTRYLNQPPAASDGAAPALAHPEVVALANIKSLLASASVVPAEHYEHIALQLIEQGIADDISLRDSLRCSPPAFDLKSAVVKQAQTHKIMKHLEKSP